MEAVHTKFLCSLIERRLRELDCLETGNGGFVCVPEEELPAGYVRLYDDYAQVYGCAQEIYLALRCANSELPVDPSQPYDCSGDHIGVTEAWASLKSFSDRSPDATVWNNYHGFTGKCVGEGENQLGVIYLLTNGGVRYGFAPTSTSFSAFCSTHDFSDRFDDEKIAFSAAKHFLAASQTLQQGS